MRPSLPIALGAILVASFAFSQTEGEAAPESPLTLEDVLDSTRLHYPPLLAAIQEIELAEGDRRAAQGKFDTGLRFGTATDQFGFYENVRLDLGRRAGDPVVGGKALRGLALRPGGLCSLQRSPGDP